MRFYLPLLCLLLVNTAIAQVPLNADSSVGIGTASPLYRLDVQSAQNNDGLRLRSLHPGQLRLVLDNMAAAKQYSFLLGGPASAFGQGNLALTDMSRSDSARLLINGNTGFVAIGGGTNPTEMLTVNGNIQAHGIRIPQNAGINRILASDATGLASWQPANALNLPSGSGSLNYLTKWTPNGFTLGNSQLVDDGTYVGVGNVAPLRKLDIHSAINYTGVNITSPQIPSLNLTATNGSNTGREVIRFGEPAATPGANNIHAQIGFFRSAEVTNANNLVITVDSLATRPDISISKTNAGNVGIGLINATQKLEVNGTVKANGLLIPTGAGAGKVLTSDASGSASWQTPATGGANPVIYSDWIVSPYTIRDSTIDGTCIKVYHIDAPSLNTTLLDRGTILVYMRRANTLGPYLLPYLSEAGGTTNQINALFAQQKILIYRHTFNTCRFNISVPPSYTGQPVMISPSVSLEYRYVLIGGTQAGGRMALGPNEHYASSLDAIPGMAAQPQSSLGRATGSVDN